MREWWERLRTRGIIPSVPSVLFTALLLAMMAASILAGRQLTRSRESHRRAANEALKEYATFAARLFGERVFAASSSERMRASATVLAAPLRPGYTVSLVDYADVARDVLKGEGHDVAGDSLLGFFKVPASRAGFEGLGAALHPDDRLQIDSTLDDVDPTRPQSQRDHAASPHGEWRAAVGRRGDAARRERKGPHLLRLRLLAHHALGPERESRPRAATAPAAIAPRPHLALRAELSDRFADRDYRVPAGRNAPLPLATQLCVGDLRRLRVPHGRRRHSRRRHVAPGPRRRGAATRSRPTSAMSSR